MMDTTTSPRPAVGLPFAIKAALLRQNLSVSLLARAAQIERTRCHRLLTGELRPRGDERQRIVTLLDFDPWEAA